MVDRYFGDDEPDRCCENCMYYEERTCGYVCSVLEAECSETELGDMSDEVVLIQNMAGVSTLYAADGGIIVTI